MLNVPAEIQAVIKNDATLKNFRVHFPNGERADITNENIVFESVSFTESVCSNDVFRFGLAEASVIEFETVGVENIVDKTIECSMEFKVPANLQGTYGEWYSIPYGTFIVDKCPRNHENMTHRRVIGYSKIKYDLTAPTFLQNRVLTSQSVDIPFSSMYAYLTGDTSFFEEQSVDLRNGMAYSDPSPYDKDGNHYSIDVVFADRGEVLKWSGLNASSVLHYAKERGYYLSFKEKGSKTNEEVGMEILNWINGLGLDLTYDGKKKKIFKDNEDMLRAFYLEFFCPAEYKETRSTDTVIVYRYQPAVINKFSPSYFEDVSKSSQYDYRFVNILVGKEGGSPFSIYITKFDSGGNAETVGTYTVSGFEAEASFKRYTAISDEKEFNCLNIKSTLVVDNSFLYLKDSMLNILSGRVFTYSNAFSLRDMTAGAAEISGGFVHSERDGTINIDRLNNENPYQLSLSDVEDNVWWDEYDVSPIGTILYTFTNPETGQIANGSYILNPENKSVYDLSGNKFIESIDLKIYKVSSASKIPVSSVSTNFYRWYLYTGTDSGIFIKGHFYKYSIEARNFVDCGVYKDSTTIMEYILNSLFSSESVNFTPVEMNLRGLPFLEAGDAITLTAQDGTVLNSYILNQTVSGIQHLTQDIESVSGEVSK